MFICKGLSFDVDVDYLGNENGDVNYTPNSVGSCNGYCCSDCGNGMNCLW